MKVRSLCMVAIVAVLVAVFAATASADTGPTDIGKALALSTAPAQGALAPGQSAWYSFVVPQEYSVEQMKRDEHKGATITPQALNLVFSDANNPDIAHNTGFHVYDPQGASWVLNGVTPPTMRTSSGKSEERTAWFAEGLPSPSGTVPDGADIFQGAPKAWQGILNDAGTYYVEVFNQSDAPMSYSLTIAGPNLSLAASAPASVDGTSASSGAGQTSASAAAIPSASDISQAAPLTADPLDMMLWPGQSAWYSFVVPEAFTTGQMERDRRKGEALDPQTITLEVSDADKPDVAENTGFYLYDPEHASWLMNGVKPPVRRDENGAIARDAGGSPQYEDAYFAAGSPAQTDIKLKKKDSSGFGLGRPRIWQGVLSSAGTYYVQVYNNSQEPLSATLTISGPNLSLASQ
ncbi:MAG: hypothetical protein U0822_20705 [Anaerolineae bacterium]